MKTKYFLLVIGYVVQQTISAQLQNPPLKPLPQSDWIKNGKDSIYTMEYVSINTTSSEGARLKVAGLIKSDSLSVLGSQHNQRKSWSWRFVRKQSNCKI